MIQRKPNWEMLLHTFLEQRKAVPFAWGQNDCALFASDALHAMTGEDLGAAFRGKYCDEAGARAQMKATCGFEDALSLAVHLCDQAGFAQWEHINFARRGDVVVLRNPDRSHSLGIVGLNGVQALFVTETGLKRMRVRSCVASWKVGL